MPLVFMIAAGAGQVENDTAETELREMSLHIIFQVSLFEILTFHGCLFASILLQQKN